jgi:hypothetical protein
MLKNTFTTILFFGLSIVISFGISLDEVRKQYVQAANNETSARALLKSLTNETNLTPVLLAYKGATRAVMAKHVGGVGKKYSLAKEGMAMLNEAVSKEPTNIEIRYLRFTVQDNVPSFLGLSGDLKSDKNAIIEHMVNRKKYQVDDSYFKDMVKFLIASDECSDEEVNKLKLEAKID